MTATDAPSDELAATDGLARIRNALVDIVAGAADALERLRQYLQRVRGRAASILGAPTHPNEGGSNVALYCPSTDALLATERTTPDVWHGGDVVGYDCDHCGGHHRFQWGPPAPLYVGDGVDSLPDDAPGGSGDA